MLTLDQLTTSIRNGSLDTVVVAVTDMQGRLVGKRVQGQYFAEHGVAESGVEGCEYLLAVDMEMEPVPGYAMANWDRGYGDFRLRPDLTTLRPIPWLPGTALLLCDLEWHNHKPVAASPRQILRRQVERARAMGFEPMFGSELEFYLFRETYAQAHEQRYRNLTPSASYILDYHILAAGYDEDVIRELRNQMVAAGITVESSKGEAWPGQHEVNFLYADAVSMADNHVVYKNGAKEIAHRHGCSITFMAKPDHRWIGNSCHLHSSLWTDGENAFAGESDTFGHYLAGQIACLKELAIFVAPTVNSYKRFVRGSWAPTTLAWGHDNRTCGFRIVGHGAALRTETRIPGGDVNPYLAFAALLAAGLHGIERELPLPPAHDGNAYESDAEQFPATLYEAIEALEQGTVARAALGDDVVDHYLNYARTEQRLYDEVVTDYERARIYERG